MDELNIQTQKEKLLSQQNQLQSDSQKQQKNSKRGCSPDSSNPESDFENLDSEIKLVVENEKDISFLSNSNSEIYDQHSTIDQLLNYKNWRNRKESPKTISPNKIYFKDISLKKKIFLINEQKIRKPFHSKYASNNPENNEGCESCNNKSTKSDEDSETRIEQFHYITESDIYNDNNDFLYENNMHNFKENCNNNINENEEKEKNIKNNNTPKENENINNNNTKPKKKTIEEKVKEKILSNFYANNNNNNISNNTNNMIKSNIFMNGFNYCANSSNCDQINYTSQTKNCLSPFFQRTYLPPPIYPIIPPNYNNYPSNLGKRNIIPTNNISIKNINNENEIKKVKNEDEKYLNIKKDNEKNEQQNKFNNNIYVFNEKIRKNSIDVASMVMNQNNNPNLLRYQKMNLNMVYYPQIQIKLQNATSQKLIQQNNNTNIINENHSSENIIKNVSEISNSKEDSPKENTLKMKEKDEKKLNIDNNKSTLATNNNNQKQKLNSIVNTNNYNNNISNKNCNNINKINNNSNINNNNINSSNLIQNNNNLYKGGKQVLNLDDIVTGKDTRTTVMIRNIPIKYTDEILIETLKEFSGKYDCLYMPYDFDKNGNKGYAFINFVNPLHILYFYEKFSGKKWVLFESSKICELNVAHFQGISEIQKHAKNFKGYKKPNFYNDREKSDNLIIPSKYLMKLKKRFPKMVYSENKQKKIIVVKSLE